MLSTIGDPGSLFYDHPGWWAVGILAVFLLLQVEIFLHECGHWLMARLCGYRPLVFSVGEGKLLWKWDGPGSSWRWHFWPLTGYIVAVKTQGRETRWQHFALSFGGPLFTLLAAGAFYAGYRELPRQFAGGGPAVKVLAEVCAISCCLSVISLIYNVWPGISGGRVANDGLQMLTAFRAKDFPRPSTYEHFLREMNEAPQAEATSIRAPALYCDYLRAALTERLPWMLALLDEAVALPDLSAAERAAWRRLFVSSALAEPKNRELAQAAMEAAEKWMEESAGGDVPLAVQAEMGALHLEMGQEPEARRLLYPLEKDASQPRWQAFALAYLALADFRRGYREEALVRLKKAREIDRFSHAVARVEVEIHGAFFIGQRG